MFDAISTEVHKLNRADGHTAANRVARQLVDDKWANRESKWALVSGKLLISGLSAWAQKTYGVTFGGMKPLRELTRYEIAPEVRFVVAAIEKGGSFGALDE